MFGGRASVQPLLFLLWQLTVAKTAHVLQLQWRVKFHELLHPGTLDAARTFLDDDEGP